MEPNNVDNCKEKNNTKKAKIRTRDCVIVIIVFVLFVALNILLHNGDFISSRIEAIINASIENAIDNYDLSDSTYDYNSIYDFGLANSLLNTTINTTISNSVSNVSTSNSVSSNISSGTLQTIYFEGCNLKYNSSVWNKKSLKTTDGQEKDGLVYKDNEIIVAQLGVSELDQMENTYSIDFNTDDGKKTIYDEFYSFWSSSYNLKGGSGRFSKISGNTYYATMDYGTSYKDNGGKGKLYLIINKDDNNAIISFFSKYENDLYGSDNIVEQLIKTISIDRVYNNDLSQSLDSLSAWSVYSGQINGQVGTKKDVAGGWRVLANDDSYLEIKNNEFYWYKTYEDLNDNYQYGTVKILKGKSGVKEVGVDENKVDKIIADSSGKVSENDIYTLIMTPTGIIIDGKSGDISGYREMKNIWVLVDHGSDGIEAQVADTINGSAYYYKKVKD